MVEQNNKIMSDIPSNPHHGLSLRVQVLIWVFLAGFLVLMGFSMVHTQQGQVQPGYEVPDFSLTLFSGYEYKGQSEVKISDLRGKVVFINF